MWWQGYVVVLDIPDVIAMHSASRIGNFEPSFNTTIFLDVITDTTFYRAREKHTEHALAQPKLLTLRRHVNEKLFYHGVQARSQL